MNMKISEPKVRAEFTDGRRRVSVWVPPDAVQHLYTTTENDTLYLWDDRWDGPKGLVACHHEH